MFSKKISSPFFLLFGFNVWGCTILLKLKLPSAPPVFDNYVASKTWEMEILILIRLGELMINVYSLSTIYTWNIVNIFWNKEPPSRIELRFLF